jgi:hypothetical protein
MKMLELALLNRVPFGKFNKASAFPVETRLELVDKSGCGVSERSSINEIISSHFEDSLSRLGGTAGSFNPPQADGR